MNAKHTTKQAEPRGRADLARMAGMDEDEIARTSPPELADIPEDFWDDAELVTPATKEAISLRVDRDVLEWFRAEGPRYQSRMNAVLRSYMKASQTRRRSPRQRKNASKRSQS